MSRRAIGIAAAFVASCAIDFPDYPVGDPTGASSIGTPCQSDADCPGGLCWREGTPMGGLGESPNGGLCTMSCPEGTCPGDALCHQFGTEPLCVHACIFGDGDPFTGCEVGGCVDYGDRDRCIPEESESPNCVLAGDCGWCIVDQDGCTDQLQCLAVGSGADHGDWQSCVLENPD